MGWLSPQRTLSDWLTFAFGDNATMGNTAKSWGVGDNARSNKPAITPRFQSFHGRLEDFVTRLTPIDCSCHITSLAPYTLMGRVEFGTRQEDRYGRILYYVYTQDGESIERCWSGKG